ncbi:hypothetical protein G7Y89_g9040 [Cudoniella acicularis]|uniref:Uncharacterized protein n=1 Tax=Cudoniella acicularis TaxID=354080 RepID=A0A8H4RFG0_9HELO|nr:hypothetical protein G7Y89_g9040 [Cudoniella acicularis]
MYPLQKVLQFYFSITTAILLAATAIVSVHACVDNGQPGCTNNARRGLTNLPRAWMESRGLLAANKERDAAAEAEVVEIAA